MRHTQLSPPIQPKQEADRTMTQVTQLQLPPALQAKLAAKGVTDDESLLAAMESDTVLRAEIHTFLAQNQGQIVQILLEDVMAVESDAALIALTERAPFILEEVFLETLARLIQAAEAKGDQAAADGLAQRLAILHRLRTQEDGAIADDPPPETVSQVDLLYQVVQAFLYAADEATARQVFAEAPDILLSDEARQILNHGIQPDNEQSQRRLNERKTLLRKLRQEQRTREETQ